MKASARAALIVQMLFLICCSPDRADKNMVALPGVQPPFFEVSAATDRTSATISQPILYTLKASCDPALTVTMPEVGSKMAGLRIIDFGEEGPKEIDGRLERSIWYKLQADIAGTYIIPSLTVSSRDGDGRQRTLQTPQIFIQVKSALTDQEGARSQDIIDIKPLQKAERSLKPFVLIGTGLLVLGAAVVGILVYIDRRTKRKQRAVRPAHVIALEEFERLQKERLIERGGVREHYFRLSDIFRRYIENRFALPAVEQTTQELLPEINQLEEFNSTAKIKTEEFLRYSDLIKFAKHTPASDEIEHSHQDVLAVIDETKKEEEVKT